MTPSVIDADETLSGVPVVIGTGPGEVALNDDPNGTNPSGFIVNADGTITVEEYTPSGTYMIEYQICENGASPINCATAIATITVDNPIVATDEALAVVDTSGGDITTASVIDGGETLSGIPVVIGMGAGEVTLIGDPNGTNPSGFAVNGDGTITVEENTSSGIYLIEYQICENGSVPVNCATAIATITVGNPIFATDENLGDFATSGGDLTTASVIDGGETLSGVPVVIGTGAGEVTLIEDPNGTNPSGFTVNADGSITIEENAPSGTYMIEYQICENGASPINCTTAIATITVDNIITSDVDDFGIVDSSVEVDTGSVLMNDTFNGESIALDSDGVPTEVTLTGDNVPTGLSLNPDGTITIATRTLAGEYEVVYTICENSADPANCITTIASVTIIDTCLTVSSLFSPNGDGKNDYLHISCIEEYNNNTLEIFNRWGNTVYKASGYNNNTVKFEGISNGRATISDVNELPVGTYFYVLSSGEPGSSIIKGWIYINR